MWVVLDGCGWLWGLWVVLGDFWWLLVVVGVVGVRLGAGGCGWKRVV